MSTLDNRGVASAIILIIVLLIVGGLVVAVGQHGFAKPGPTPLPQASNTQSMQLGTFDAFYGDKIIVNLAYDDSKNPLLSIANVEERKGYLPKPETFSKFYKATIVDAKEKVLDEQYIYVPVTLTYDDNQGGGGMLPMHTSSIAVEFAANPAAKKVYLYDNTDKVVDQHDITLTAASLPEQLRQTLLAAVHKFITPTYAQTSGQLRFLIVPLGYGDISNSNNQIYTDVPKFTNPLNSTAPWTGLIGSQIKVDYAKTTKDVCVPTFNVTTDASLCSPSIVRSALDAQKISYANAVIILVAKSTTISASWSWILDGYVFINTAMGPGSLTHELGHAVGGLNDEYILSNFTPFANFKPNTLYENCYTGSPPNWQTAQTNVPNSQFQAGCGKNEWTKNAQSIMTSGLAVDNYNAISLYFMNQWLNYFTGKSAAPKLAQPQIDVFGYISIGNGGGSAKSGGGSTGGGTGGGNASCPANINSGAYLCNDPGTHITSQQFISQDDPHGCVAPQTWVPAAGECLDMGPYCQAFPNSQVCGGQQTGGTGGQTGGGTTSGGGQTGGTPTGGGTDPHGCVAPQTWVPVAGECLNMGPYCQAFPTSPYCGGQQTGGSGGQTGGTTPGSAPNPATCYCDSGQNCGYFHGAYDGSGNPKFCNYSYNSQCQLQTALGENCFPDPLSAMTPTTPQSPP